MRIPTTLLTAFILILCGLSLRAQISIGDTKSRAGISEYYEIKIDIPKIREILYSAPPLFSEEKGVQIQLPLANGQFHVFEMYEAPIMQADLGAKFNMINSYKGFDVHHPERVVRVNIGPLGLFALIADQNDQSIIQPLLDEERLHHLYFSRNTYSNWTCSTTDELEGGKRMQDLKEQSNNCTVNGADYHTYTIVVTTTGEFYNLNGGNMTSAMNALVNRLAAVLIPYERDLAMTFQLHNDNDLVMFTDPNTDPYTDPTNRSTSIDQAETTIETVFPLGDYDIGHGYHEITCGGGCGWGGLAGVAVACVNGSKARAWTYQPNDIVTNTVWSHEFGHQLSCWHTNYGCSNTGCHRYEPGEGATIMSTGAGCTNNDDYTNRVDFFHAKSIDAIIEYTNNGDYNSQSNNCNVVNHPGWTNCVQQTNSGNSPPTVTANPNNLNLTIPINTPFRLEGTATDADGDALTYTWVDYNTNVNTSTTPQNSASSTSAPLFRWFSPSSDTFRYFPQLSSIQNGNATSGTGEVLPTVGRTMDFRFIARDNASPYGAIACDELSITVDGNSGPFEVSSQNSATSWTSGDTETITWNVNNTDQSPINASNVDILLSTDGGEHFIYTLSSNTPNDGSHTITVPNVTTSTARIKVQPSGNYIFFDINDADIDIVNPSCSANAYSISPTNQLTASEGDPSLNLDMQNEYGSPTMTYADSTVASDPTVNIAYEGVSGGSCVSGGNQPHQKDYVINVDQTGTYTISHGSGDFPLLMNLYSPSFNSSSVCTNWLSSNGKEDGSGSITLNSSFNETLNTGQDYVLTVNGVFSGNTKTYTLNFSGPGDLYLGYIPISGFSYTYVIVGDASGNIVDFDANADLTDDAPGNYTIYGVHYDDNVNLNTYEGGSFSTFQNDIFNGTICASLSSNSRPVEIQSVLPLDFLDFEAYKEGEHVNLHWLIGNAYDLSHFEVQRWSYKHTDFISLELVEWSKAKTLYSSIDEAPLSGQNLYRILSVDIDGTKDYSPIRTIYFDSEINYAVFPSPASSMIYFKGPVHQTERIQIYNTNGQMLYQGLDAFKRGNLNVEGWHNGIYIIAFKTDAQTVYKKFVISH